VDDHFAVSSASSRMLAYLQAHLGETVTAASLSGVAGTQSWARRVRELREDNGWVIHTHTTNSSIAPGQYRLVFDQPRPELVEVWAAAKSAAKLRTKGGPVEPATRMHEFLRSISPQPAARDQLGHVIGGSKKIDECVRSLERRGVELDRISTDDLVCPGGIGLMQSKK